MGIKILINLVYFCDLLRWIWIKQFSLRKIHHIVSTIGCFIDLVYELFQIKFQIPTLVILRSFRALKITCQSIHVYHILQSIPNIF